MILETALHVFVKLVKHLEAVLKCLLLIDSETQVRIESSQLDLHINMDGQQLFQSFLEVPTTHLFELNVKW